jgi:hypothetical protein
VGVCIGNYEDFEEFVKYSYVAGDYAKNRTNYNVILYSDSMKSEENLVISCQREVNRIINSGKLDLKYFPVYNPKRNKYMGYISTPVFSNLFIDMEGFYHRVLFWQQYLYNIKGFLYWQTTHWNNGSPWDVTSPVPELSYYCFGDGSLLYNGDRIGVDGPVGSYRLELIRSAIEDYQMFQLAEEAFGREYMEEQLHKITKNIREYCDDHRLLAKMRWEIGDKLSNYYSQLEV